MTDDIDNRAVYFRTTDNGSVVKVDLTRITWDGEPHMPKVSLQATRFTHDMTRTFTDR